MNTTRFDWRYVLSAGLLAGGIVLYTSVVGMLESFHERDVIRETLTLGQILLFLPIIGMAFLAGRKVSSQVPSPAVPVVGLFVGLIASLPLLLLIWGADNFDLRRIFVNISRNLIEILTFENEDHAQGGLSLVLSICAAGFAGAVLNIIPAKIRGAFFVAVGTMLIIGTLSELVVLILEQVLNRDQIALFFRRRVLLPNAALGIFFITATLALFWAFGGNNVQQRVETMPAQQKQYLTYGGVAVLSLLLLVLPWLLGTFLSEVMADVGLYILMGLGLNIAIGLAGLLDLGYVTNFAVGAYTMGVLTSTGPLGLATKFGIGFTFWTALPICVMAAMLTGFIFAVPVLRMRGDYLAIATLGFGEIIRLLALSDWLRPVVGGAQGVLFIPKPIFLGTTVNGPQELYYVILAACLLAVYVSVRLNNSRTGRQWMSIREDEDVASAMGIDTSRAKLLAFTLSAATGGMAGAIFAAKLGTIFPNSFELLVSVNVLSLIIVGGMGSIPGIIVGAFVLRGLPQVLREFEQYRLLLYGALLVFMMRARPEGLWPSAVRRREIHDQSMSSSTIPAVGD